MKTEIRVLIVEDNDDLRDSMIQCLSLTGLTVFGVGSAAQFYQALVAGVWNVAVVDIGLPDQSGYVLVEYLRANTSTKIIILTARDTIEDRVSGYGSGADLYLVKPFDTRELAAAITSLAHRQLGQAEQIPVQSPVAETWILDQKKWCLAAPNGVSIELTAKELQFLTLLAEAPGSPVTRDRLLSTLYRRYDEHTSRSLDSLVRRLRKKIMETCGLSVPIKTAHAVGYCFSSRLSLT